MVYTYFISWNYLMPGKSYFWVSKNTCGRGNTRDCLLDIIQNFLRSKIWKYFKSGLKNQIHIFGTREVAIITCKHLYLIGNSSTVAIFFNNSPEACKYEPQTDYFSPKEREANVFWAKFLAIITEHNSTFGSRFLLNLQRKRKNNNSPATLCIWKQSWGKWIVLGLITRIPCTRPNHLFPTSWGCGE